MQPSSEAFPAFPPAAGDMLQTGGDTYLGHSNTMAGELGEGASGHMRHHTAPSP
jgi:hypothetical protein